MSTLFEAAQRFFEQDDWPVERIPDQTVLRTSFRGDDGSWACVAQVREPHQQFVFYSFLPVRVSEDRRPAMAEFITRANYGMIIGNFEMDYADGEVRYKTSIDVEGSELTFDLARYMVYANVVTMDRYFKAALAVATTDMDPELAIFMVEGNPGENRP